MRNLWVSLRFPDQVDHCLNHMWHYSNKCFQDQAEILYGRCQYVVGIAVFRERKTKILQFVISNNLS